MKLALISDIHSNHWRVSDEYITDLLVKQCKEAGVKYLFDAGDSCWKNDIGLIENVFNKHDIEYIHIPGNHEYYDRSILDISSSRNRDRRILSNFDMVKATLWSNINGHEYMHSQMNDFHCIDGMTPVKYQKLHEKDLNNLQFVLDCSFAAYEKLPKIIMTHHAPSKQSVCEQYNGHPLNPYFCNDLEQFILDRPKIKLWMHGHVHSCHDYIIGDCRVVANPCGYPGENYRSLEDYKIKIIEV